MPRPGKKYLEALKLVDREKRYSVDEACALVGKTAKKKFDETVDVAIRLGVDPKHADQMVRGAVVLPHGIGKTVRVAVFAKGDNAHDYKFSSALFEDYGNVSPAWRDMTRAQTVKIPEQTA